MARVPYTGVPEVAPQGEINLDVNAGQFGGLIAGAEQRAGSQLQQGGAELGGAAVQRQDLVNQTAADQAFNDLQDRYHKIQFGDPNDPTTPGYYALKGQDALNARPGVQGQIDSAQADIMGGLQNARQKVLFQNASRRLRSLTLDDIGRHANQQFDVYAASTQKASAEIALRNIGTFYNDDTQFAHNLEELRRAAVRAAQLQGGGPEMVTAALNHADSLAVVSRAEAMGVHDPSGAAKFLDDHQSSVDPSAYQQLATHLRGQAELQLAPQIFAQASAGAVQPKPVTGTLPERIVSAESGGNANAANPASSAKGAGQFIDKTWLDQVKRNAPALAQGKSDPQILAMRSDPVLAQQMVTTYAAENADFLRGQNLPTDDGSLYLAHVAGPQGAAAVLQADPNTPVAQILSPDAVKANPNLASMNAGQFRQWAADKVGGNDLGQTRASVIQRIGDATKDNPGLQRAALSYANEQFKLMDAAQIDQERQRKLYHEQVADASDAEEQQLLQRAHPLPGENAQPITATEIAHNPTLTREAKDRWIKLLGSGADESDPRKYGPGFYSLFQRTHLPDNDPQKITGAAQLYDHIGPSGDLTIAGLKELSTDLTGRNSPGAEGTSKMVEGALAYAKHQLSFEADYGIGGKIPDPHGQDLFNSGFLPSFFKSYQEGLAAGKTPYQLLSRDSPDFIVDKIAAPFKRNPSQLLKDQMEAGIEPGTQQGATPQAAPDLSTPQGLVAAVRAGQVPRAQGEALALKNGWIRAAQPAGPQAPILGQP